MTPTTWSGASVAGGAADVDTPTVSIVIPMRNEEKSIGRCLEAVRAQDYPPGRIEVLVVDGRSTDGSREVVEAFARRDPRIRLLDNPSGSIPAGLNIGIVASGGDVVARLDGRTELASDYVSAGVRLLRRTGASNVGGAVLSVNPSYMGRVLALVWESRFGMGGAAARYGEATERDVDTVYMGMYPRGVLERIGLYDEEMVRDQDDELNYRLRAHGGRVLLTPTMRSRYLNSSSPRRFARQNFLYGYWKVRVCQKHPRMASARHLVPPAFVLGLLAGPAMAAASAPAAAAFVAALAGYAAGAVGAAASIGRRAGWRYALPLPALFLLTHVAWGSGFLIGLVRFFPRWFTPEPPPPVLARARDAVET